MHKILIAALAILSASACASAPAPPPAAEPVSTVAPMLDSLTPDDDGVFTSDRSGNFTHVQSGFICPNTWSGFQRTTHTVFKPAGNDVGCNYEDASGSVVTLYAYSYPAFPPLELEMDSIMQRIVKMRNPVHEDTDVMIVAKPSARGFGYVGDAILIDRAGDEKIKTGVFLTDAGPWRLKAQRHLSGRPGRICRRVRRPQPARPMGPDLNVISSPIHPARQWKRRRVHQRMKSTSEFCRCRRLVPA